MADDKINIPDDIADILNEAGSHYRFLLVIQRLHDLLNDVVSLLEETEEEKKKLIQFIDQNFNKNNSS